VGTVGAEDDFDEPSPLQVEKAIEVNAQGQQAATLYSPNGLAPHLSTEDCAQARGAPEPVPKNLNGAIAAVLPTPDLAAAHAVLTSDKQPYSLHVDRTIEADGQWQQRSTPISPGELPPHLSKEDCAHAGQDQLPANCPDAAAEDRVPAEGDAVAAGILLPLHKKSKLAADPALGTDTSVTSAETIDEPSPQAPVPRPARKYRARLGQPSQRQPAERTRRKPDSSAEPVRGTLDAELVVFIQPGGWGIRTALVLRRAAEMPEELSIRLGSDTYDLGAVGSDFYEPLSLPDAHEALAGGIAAETAAGCVARWVRGGRSLHIFTARTGIAGFVSSARAVMGQENLVLCTAELAEACLAACLAGGSPAPLDVSGPGIPRGWRCFRGIRPTQIAVAGLEGILLALVPHPQATIELGGGIPLGNSAWLIGHPPAIQIIGATPAEGEVAIDGHAAASSGDQGWTAPGWDLPGPHAITYAGISRTYELVQAPGSWQRWQAHANNGMAVCGASATGSRGHQAIASARGNAWLLGSAPGDIQEARPLHGHPISVAAPDFQPVWEVALHGRRSRHSVRLIGPPSPPLLGALLKQRASIQLWCHVLRTAGPEPWSLQDQPSAIRDLWAEYRRAAHPLGGRKR
jgi:hypothetical protein